METLVETSQGDGVREAQETNKGEEDTIKATGNLGTVDLEALEVRVVLLELVVRAGLVVRVGLVVQAGLVVPLATCSAAEGGLRAMATGNMIDHPCER